MVRSGTSACRLAAVEALLCLAMCPGLAEAFAPTADRLPAMQLRPARERACICRATMAVDVSRRSVLAVLVAGGLAMPAGVIAKPGSKAGGSELDVKKLQIGLRSLNDLIDNWDDQTTECNFAEVTRELLETKNKAALLEAAKTNALFNKDVSMVVKCKRNPAPIRVSMGFDDFEHPLYGSTATVARCRSRVADPDALDAYIDAEETWNQVYNSAKTMSYSAQMRAVSILLPPHQPCILNHANVRFLAARAPSLAWPG